MHGTGIQTGIQFAPIDSETGRAPDQRARQQQSYQDCRQQTQDGLEQPAHRMLPRITHRPDRRSRDDEPVDWDKMSQTAARFAMSPFLLRMRVSLSFGCDRLSRRPGQSNLS